MSAKPGCYDPLRAVPPLALPRMRIGLLGGSFNPAHEGHLHVSRIAIQRLELHRIWWLVTPGNPLKQTEGQPGQMRRMISAERVADHPRIMVTGFEAALGSAFTVNTIAFLRRRHPEVRFVWIMGGDNLAQLHRWKHWPRLFSLVPILVLDRPEARLPALASPAARTFASSRLAERCVGKLTTLEPPAWAYLSIPLSQQSSTAIRQAQHCANDTQPYAQAICERLSEYSLNPGCHMA
jgi:nicotinate-nucleotide adenylyltransferase